MNLHGFSACRLVGLALVWLAFIPPESSNGEEPVQAPSKQTQNGKPSWFDEDARGILWFRQGGDAETKYSASLVLSAVTDGIVITVTANEAHMKNALKLAAKMQTVLQKNAHTPDKVPIVAWKDTLAGVGYTFYTDGMSVGREHIYANKGVFTPSKAKSKDVLSLVVKQFRILGEMAADKRWGENDHEETALKIKRS